ncbi:MAG: hypothetical protein CFE33_05870 [Pseudorhodobacter sp. PARRP1]|nr:MAG: hypothetical protein CFE33_05870 [Pseudorhodobacter sp. PARRP1]
MNMKSAVLLCLLASPCLGDTINATTCPLSGPLNEMSSPATKDCQVHRLAFRDALRGCMDRLQDPAKHRTARLPAGNAQTSRSRFLICYAAAHKSMDVAPH